MRKGVRTKAACQIAQVDPARFNEMVHAGHFPCAPETRPGSARIFDLDQAVSLKIFGELLSLSMSPERAGQIACAAYRVFAGRQNVETIILHRDAFGEWTIREQTSFFNVPTFFPVKLVFDVSELREQIGDALEWEEKNGEDQD